MFTGNWYFIDAVNGQDGNTGAADNPLQTVYGGYSRMVSGNNDVLVIVGNGASSGSQRMSLAAAQAITPAATTGTITWAKNACHMIGMTAPTAMNQRARFAPPTGTYAASTFSTVSYNSGSYTTFFLVTGSGCFFSNFSLFQGFSTGASSNQVCWINAGNQNYYSYVNFIGMADAASAGSTTAGNMVFSGDENRWENCTFGSDTVVRSAANSSITPVLGGARNTFKSCRFVSNVSSATATVMTVAASSMDRWIEMTDCVFLNAVASGGTAMNQAFAVTGGGSPDGFILLNNPSSVGATKFETSSSGYLYITGAVPTFATTGIGVL